jgi:geranylgeranyl pyrophosphate synthase
VAEFDAALVRQALESTRDEVHAEFERLLAERRRTGYGRMCDLMASYLLRPGSKFLRPALLRAAFQAAGGTGTGYLVTATSLEMFHKAALVIDDCNDRSQTRWGRPTIYGEHGADVAVVTGFGMTAAVLELLIANLQEVGVRKTLEVQTEFGRMAAETAEGQLRDILWIHEEVLQVQEEDYMQVASRKTGTYTAASALYMGVLLGASPGAAAPTAAQLLVVREFGQLVGIAFQACDDILNALAPQDAYEKPKDDLYEPKPTPHLYHFLRTAQGATLERALRFLRAPRPAKAPAEADWLLEAMRDHGSLAYAQEFADACARRALAVERDLGFLEENEGRRFLREAILYAVQRDR